MVRRPVARLREREEEGKRGKESLPSSATSWPDPPFPARDGGIRLLKFFIVKSLPREKRDRNRKTPCILIVSEPKEGDMRHMMLCVVIVMIALFSGACGVPRPTPSPQFASAINSDPTKGAPPDESSNHGATVTARVPQVSSSPRNGGSEVAGITPGTAVSSDNWQIAQEVLSRSILDAVREGEMTILVQETSDLPASAEYMNATREYSPHVALDKDGNLVNYRAGLPFPTIDPVDPQAGLKIAWNTRYAD